MKILLVDDREENLQLLELTLRGSGAETSRASDGEKALHLLREQSFDAVVSDIMMPTLDGFQLCRKVREDDRWRTTAFVFVTATYTDPRDETLALKLGADAFFTKPIDPDSFAQSLQQVIAKRKGLRETSPAATLEDTAYWKEYASRIVSKLEDKISELELAHHKQRMLNESLEARVEERTAALAAKSNELSASNRELSAFAYSIAHDFRSPLRSIGLMVELMREETHATGTEKTKKMLARIERAATKMSELLESLLSYTAVTTVALVPEAVDVNAAMATVLELLSADIQASGARVVVEDKLPVVLAHRSILEQVLLNLVGNSLKFVAPGVKPDVHVGLARPAASPRSHARFWIEDNGIGIPQEYHQRVFGLFERLHTEQAYPGSGLGLSIVRRGVERMGGRVGLISDRVGGSCFWLELPRAPTADMG